MNCPFLILNYSLTCKANNTYLPSGFQIEEYCRSKRYSLCPFFKLRAKGEKIVAENQ